MRRLFLPLPIAIMSDHRQTRGRGSKTHACMHAPNNPMWRKSQLTPQHNTANEEPTNEPTENRNPNNGQQDPRSKIHNKDTNCNHRCETEKNNNKKHTNPQTHGGHIPVGYPKHLSVRIKIKAFFARPPQICSRSSS